MDHQKLMRLLQQAEGPKLDFKLKFSLHSETDKKELSKDVIALANSPGGRGHLIVGVEDKTKDIIGVNPQDYPEEKIQQIILNRCDPPITLRVEQMVVHDKTLVVITVFNTHKRPHQMRQTGAFYIRRGSTTDFARRDEIAAMLQHGGLIYDEMIPIYHAKTAHLDPEMVSAQLLTITGEANDPENEDLLADVGILFYEQEDRRYYPTIGGLLLFGKHPQLLLPHTGVKIIFHDANNHRQESHIHGHLIRLLDESMAQIKAYIAPLDYPTEAIEEVLANALIHRDYFDTSRKIVVYIGEKNIEISNPGAIFDTDPLNHVIRSSSPKRRNNWLYHQLLNLDPNHRFNQYGMGLMKIKKLIQPIGSVRFINIKKNNLFKVVLPGLGHVRPK